MKLSNLWIAVVLAALVIFQVPVRAASDSDSISFESSVRELAGGFKFTEGPAVDKDGNIFFTDIPNNRIHQWSVDGKLSTFLENTEGANGLYFDKEGNLLACLGGAAKLVSYDRQGNKTVLVEHYNDKPFNSLNDLWIAPDGGVYFTDPRYGSRENMPQDGEHVYYRSADGKRLIRVIADMTRPNGVLGTADGKILYVADHGGGKTYAYKINPEGTLSDKKLFAEQGADGMTLDSNGNVYLAAKAVTIYNPSGKLIGTIEVPQTPSNVCFGKDKKTLFITARTSLYSIRMQSKFYSFTLNDIEGKAVSLSQYAGKTLLVVNVASKCGFTGQYAGLQTLYEKYKDQGLVVLGLPANDFLGQEPGTNAQIKAFCSSKFNVSFPVFEKISVKGKEMHPLYHYLTSPVENGEFGQPITWNFNKFLIGKDGRTIARFGSRVEPLDAQIVQVVEKALKD